MILHKYYSLDFIMKMKIRQLSKLLLEAFLKQQREEAYKLYLAFKPRKEDDTYQSFDEFYEPISKQTEHIADETKSAEDILLEVKEIMASNRWE